MIHKHPDYKGFVSTVLPRRVTFGCWVKNAFCETSDVFLNNHKVGHINKWLKDGDVAYHLYNEVGSDYSAYNLLELLPFVGYTSEGTEF